MSLPRPVPAYAIDQRDVEQAFAAYTALHKAACADPALVENPFFIALQDTAYARFLARFEAI